MTLATLLLAYTIYDFYPTQTVRPEEQSIVHERAGGEGELLVLSTDPAERTIIAPRGATRVPLLTLKLTTSCDAPVTVTDIRLRHTGRGSADDVTAVYAVSNLRRISRARTFDQDGSLTLRITRFSVDSCDAEEIEIFGSLSTDAAAAAEHTIVLNGADAIISSAAVTRTDTEQTAESTVISSPFDPGSVTLTMLPTRVPMNYGSIQTLARMQVSADAEGSHLLRSITLTNEGSARDYNFIDMRIEDRQGNVLSRLAHHMDGRQVTLFFDPMVVLERSQTKVLLLRGEIRTSYARSVNFELEEEADLVTVPYQRRLPR